jgi:hypothetical protein
VSLCSVAARSAPRRRNNWVRVHRTGRITGATVTHTCQMRTVATFRLIGAEQGHTASAATARLGVQPSRAYEAGTPVCPGSDKIREVSSWYLDSGGPAYSVALAAQLHRLLYVLEPVAAPVWELVKAGYWANWFCYLGSYPAEHAAELDRATLQRLLLLPGDLWLDVYDDYD